MNQISHTKIHTFFPKGQLNPAEQQALAKANTAEEESLNVGKTVSGYDESQADRFQGQEGHIKLERAYLDLNGGRARDKQPEGHWLLSATMTPTSLKAEKMATEGEAGSFQVEREVNPNTFRLERAAYSAEGEYTVATWNTNGTITVEEGQGSIPGFEEDKKAGGGVKWEDYRNIGIEPTSGGR